MKKARTSFETIRDVFLRHQDAIVQAMPLPVFGIVEGTEDKSGSMKALYRCLICGNEFPVVLDRMKSSYKNIVCPDCGAKQPETEWCVQPNERLSKVAIVAIHNPDSDCYYFGDITVSGIFNEGFDLEGLEFNFKNHFFGEFNPSTNEKTVYAVNGQGEPKISRKSFQTLWGWSRFGIYIAIGFDKTDVAPAFSWSIDATIIKKWLTKIDSIKKEKKEKAPVIYPAELSEPVKAPPLKQLTKILTEELSWDLVTKKTAYKHRCLMCGSEWLDEVDAYNHPPFECPYCGTMESIHPYRGYGQKKSLYLSYLSSNATEVVVKTVEVEYDNNTLNPDVTAKLVGYCTFDEKGRSNNFYCCSTTWETAKYNAVSGSKNLCDVVIESTDGLLKYSGIEEYVASLKAMVISDRYYYWKTDFNSRNLLMFINDAIKYSVTEKIVKLGLTQEYLRKYEKSVQLNLKADTVQEAFGISKELLRYYRDVTQTQKKDLDIALMQTLYSFDNNVKGVDVYWCNKHQITLEAIEPVIKEVPDLTISKVTSYLERVRLSQMFDPKAAIVQWRDYLAACNSIGMDMHDNHVLYPRALKTEHDVVMAKQQFIADETIRSKFMNAVDAYRELEYHRDDYFIKVPDTMESMFEEGRKLKHCCGRYVDDVAEGSAFVLFLRKKADPDEPYLSIEVLPDLTVRQVRGMNDSYISVLPEHKEISIFLTHWAKMKHLTLDMR